MTTRRTFIALLGGAAAWPLAARAQNNGKIRRVGILANEQWPPIDGLRDGLRELGHVEGQNLALVHRYVVGQAERYAAVAAELVRLPVDVIVTTFPWSSSQRSIRLRPDSSQILIDPVATSLA